MASCFLLLWDCTHCCQCSLFKQHILLRSVYKIQLIVLWVIHTLAMLQIVVSHVIILFVIFGSHASKCVSSSNFVVMILRLIFLCHRDTVLHFFPMSIKGILIIKKSKLCLKVIFSSKYGVRIECEGRYCNLRKDLRMQYWPINAFLCRWWTCWQTVIYTSSSCRSPWSLNGFMFVYSLF